MPPQHGRAHLDRDAASHVNQPAVAAIAASAGLPMAAFTRGQTRVNDITSCDNSANAGGNTVNTPTYDKGLTALLVVDPYNDFISEGGKIWPHIKAVAEANNCVPHMLEVLNAARKAKLRVFYAMHHRYCQGNYETWKYVAPIQRAAWQHKTFEYGSWGGEFRAEFVPASGEIVAQEPLCRRTWLRGHGATRRDGGLVGPDDARRARRQHAELRQRDCQHGRDRRRDCHAVNREGGTKRTCRHAQPMSAFEGKADIARTRGNVR